MSKKFWVIFAWIASVVLLLTSLGSLLTSAYISFILYLIPGLFILPLICTKIEEKIEFAFNSGFKIFVPVFFIVIAAFINDGSFKIESGDKITGNVVKEDGIDEAIKSKEYAMNEDISFINITYNVINAESFSESGEKFLKIYLKITNNAKYDVKVSQEFKITDSQNREFYKLCGKSEGEIAFDTEIKPGFVLEGTMIFLISNDSSDLKLGINDANQMNALVDIDSIWNVEVESDTSNNITVSKDTAESKRTTIGDFCK